MKRIALALCGLLWASPALAIGTINIANAPEWQQSHAYILGDRVLAGPALVIPSTYTSGSNLYLWAVTTAGTSSGSGNGPQTCASPAGTGGIPTGSWGGATTATDGSVTWTCLTKVDYVSITGFNCDDSRTWAQSTTYHHIDQVVNAGHCYSENNTFSGASPCTSLSSGSGPTGTTFNTGIADNNCEWYYQGELTYSSQANRLPHQLSNGGGSSYNVQFAQNVTVQLWWGGNQRTHYGPQQPNELSPLQVHYHQDQISDANLFATNGTTPAYDAVSSGVPYRVTIQPPTGDRLLDNVTSASGPLRYDETKGVAIFTNAASGALGAGDALNLGDSFTCLIDVQIQATQGEALPTTPANYLFGPTNTNEGCIRQSIIIGAGSGPITLDYGWEIDNSLIESTSATAGSFAIHAKFQTVVHDSTLICASGVTNSTGFQQNHFLGTNTTLPMNNNLILGCVNPYSSQDAISTSGANNATDVVGTPSGTFTDLVFGGTQTAAAFPGTTLTGLTAANQLVNPTLGASFDGRVKNTSANIYSAGATFSFSQSGSQSLAWASPVTPGTDILGISRAFVGRYDIGAETFIGTTGIGGGGRSWFH